MLKFPNGAVFGLSTAIAAAITASAVTNANPAVATTAADALADGDVVVMQSAWSLANNAVAVADSLTSTTAALRGLNALDTTLFEAGQAAMKLLVASAFVDFNQQGDPSTSGGEQQFWTGQFLEDKSGRQISVPTFKNAKTLTLPLFYDPSLPWYAAAKAAAVKKEPVVLRCKLPDGDALYWYGYLSFDSDPTIAANNPMGNTMTFTALGESSLVESA